MTKDWNANHEVMKTHQAILDRMKQFGENVATVPFASYIEHRDGTQVWCVDLHVKVKSKTEFEISAEATSLGDALRRAWLGLSNTPMVLRRAAATNAQFGIEP